MFPVSRRTWTIKLNAGSKVHFYVLSFQALYTFTSFCILKVSSQTKFYQDTISSNNKRKISLKILKVKATCLNIILNVILQGHSNKTNSFH
mmetsp:Transcript_61812/g.74376  ORF Transcript_61812/g.74376 Transcript_61812/m.74376 type:complete len:91 (-) Transcript_61812:126-398(-)